VTTAKPFTKNQAMFRAHDGALHNRCATVLLHAELQEAAHNLWVFDGVHVQFLR
jgi:hypothetical protein